MKLTPNLEMNFRDMPFLNRVACAADLGFTGADMFRTKDRDIPALAAKLRKHKITIGMVVGSQLEVGLNDPEIHPEIEKSAEAAARDAAEIGALYVTVLSGNSLPKVSASQQNRNIVDGLKRLIPIAEKYNVTILLEMLNSLYTHPGYYLDDTELMTSIIRTVGHPRVKGLYDIFHAGIMRGNIVEDIRASIDAIGHFHIAGIPGRNEPINGEQNYPMICREIDKTGYEGYISMEYTPRMEPIESLKLNKAWIEGKK